MSGGVEYQDIAEESLDSLRGDLDNEVELKKLDISTRGVEA